MDTMYHIVENTILNFVSGVNQHRSLNQSYRKEGRSPGFEVDTVTKNRKRKIMFCVLCLIKSS